MKKKLLILGFVAVLVAGGLLAYRAYAAKQANADSELQTAVVSLGSLSSTLSSSGNVYAGQSATIVWETSGKVNEITLQQGNVVEEGQVLASLDSASLSSEVINARQDLVNARQALEDLLNSRLQQAQALQAVENAQQALNNLRVAAAGDTSQAQLALATTQEAYDDALQTRNAMNYPHSTDELVIQQAETQYLLAKEAYKEAQKEFAKYEKKPLTNPDRIRALSNLIAAEQRMDEALATYNWYLLGYTDEEIAQADAEVAVALANLEAAQANWESLKDGTSDAAVALAEANLEDAQRDWERLKDGPDQATIAAAQAAVYAAQEILDRVELVAPFAGTVTDVNASTGDLVSAGDAAFRIDDLANLYIDLMVSEIDLPALDVSQPATLEFDAIADRVYEGEVTEIGMIGTNSQGVVNYPVTVRLANPDDAIRPGMTASVTIITDQVDDVLLVPNKAIRTSNGQQTVTVLFEGQQITVPVSVGLTSDNMSQVTSNQLLEGDVVVVYGSSSSSTASNSQPNVIEFRGEGSIESYGGPPPGMIP